MCLFCKAWWSQVSLDGSGILELFPESTMPCVQQHPRQLIWGQIWNVSAKNDISSFFSYILGTKTFGIPNKKDRFIIPRSQGESGWRDQQVFKFPSFLDAVAVIWSCQVVDLWLPKPMLANDAGLSYMCICRSLINIYLEALRTCTKKMNKIRGYAYY